MRRISLHFSLLALFAAASLNGLGACGSFVFNSSAVGSTGAGTSGEGGGWFDPDAGVGGATESTDASSGTGASSPVPPYYDGSYAYLCGALTKGDGGLGGAGGGSGGEVDAGVPPVCTPGLPGCMPDADGGLGGGYGDGGPFTCDLSAVDGQAVPACVPAGDFAVGDPCENAAHCGAGLGCVATASGGICREYCCAKVEDCPGGTYCAPLAMAEASVMIPVCVPAKKCKPLDDTSCPDGQTCTIVRDDGTTSCVDPGPGARGEGCPCAPGHVCSKVTNTCLQLCHIGDDAECSGGTCQGGVMGYPEGIGICVGVP